jgi:2-polyprenyl-6-methoxyphenol hydroxylase-like FAD-dependent oxidoreductase
MPLGGRRIGIVGGGIGGLATAITLAARGAHVVVFERRRAPDAGVALLVWGNAMRALAMLGVADALRPFVAPIERTLVRNRAGDVLSELPIGEWSKAAPSVTVRRGDLVNVLAAKAGDVVRAGDVVGFEPRGERVRVELADGEELVDALIGADGLHSIVRAKLLGDEAPRALKQQAWVGWVNAKLERGVTTATIGHGPRFWSAPLVDGAFWYATINKVVGDRRDVLRETFRDWHAPIGELIASTKPADIVATQIRDRAPVTRWGTGAVTLLGDAAHATTPDLGQGACQAIESAVVLGASLERADSIEAGLRAYERARMDRTATISRLCWMTSINSTIESPLLCQVRDGAVKLGLRAVARGHLEWILAGQPC